MRQAAKYTDEHLNGKGDYEVHIHNDALDLLRAKKSNLITNSIIAISISPIQQI